ncbi:putative rRNA-processing protein Efg1 [Blattamonas nauphoetae]|uniref:rRNA-processing protein EFG1 n=1 Tax=Blattamonas nauphoetae TaxID=2049346 RepID=A0ABQ9Y9L3_9EUKA|nr:putative rRNA-processing protein Efg1 [Blattamonas nauphoetae]
MKGQKRPQKPQPPKPEPKRKSLSHRSTKQKIRDIERIMARKSDITPEEKASLERRIQAIKEQQTERVQEKRTKKFKKRYQGIMFVEQKKIKRRLKKYQQLLSEIRASKSTAKSGSKPAEPTMSESDCTAEIQKFENYLFYIQNYPAGQKYISVFPSENMTPEEIEERRQIQLSLIEKMKQEHRDGKAEEEQQREREYKEFKKDDDFFA